MENQNEYMSENEKNRAALEADLKNAPKPKSNCLMYSLIALLVAFFFLAGTLMIGGTLLGKLFKSKPDKAEKAGNITSNFRELAPFTRIAVDGAGNVEIECGKEQKVEISADSTLISSIETEVQGDTLHITSLGNPFDKNKADIKISLEKLDELSASGAANVKIINLKNENVKISQSGAGEVDIKSAGCKELDFESSGASNIKAEGECEKVKVNLSGTGSIEMKDLKTDDVDISISGAGSAQVYASKNLNVEISGAGSVDYYGNPENVKKEISGTGSIEKK